jgi:outer membrane protein assembly factor BamA
MEYFLKKELPISQNLTERHYQLVSKQWLFIFSINAVEVKTVNDTIDFEIRVTEGPLAYFNKITVTGNDKTNRVIYRIAQNQEKNTAKKNH